MSHQTKRKRIEDIQVAVSSIKELLVTVKPLLRVPLLPNVPNNTLINTLTSLARQSEALSVLCSRKSSSRLTGGGGEGRSPGKVLISQEDQDLLDGEGVNIWNRSGEHKLQAQPGTSEVYGAMRHAGFRLIEAGYDGVFDAVGAIRLLVLGSKAGAALALGGDDKASLDVLSRSAWYEEEILNLPPAHSEGESQERARAVTQYYIARTELGFRTGQLEMAEHFFIQAIDERRVAQLGPKEIYDLITVAQEIANYYLGPSTMDRDGERPAEVGLAEKGVKADEWLTRALKLGDAAARVGGPGHGGKVRRDTMTSLALALVLSATVKPDNLERAELALDELLADPELLRDDGEASQTRWLKLECVRRRKTGDGKVIEAFKGIVDNDVLVDLTVDRILRELMHSKTSCSRPVATAVLQMLLTRLVKKRPDAGRLGAVSRTLLSVAIHAKGSDNIDRGCREIRTALDTVEDHPAYKPEPAACAAYQTVFWQMGDAAYAADKFAEAAKCYELGAHPSLSAKQSTLPKIYRKVALCFIRLQDYERAMAMIEACSPEESATHYLRFLVFAHQGLEEAAIEALRAMTQTAGMDGRQLILATQLAKEQGLSNVILASLHAILLSIRSGTFVTEDIAIYVLVRTIVRLTLKQIDQASSEGSDVDRDGYIDSLVNQFQSAVEIATRAVADNEIPPAKELCWLYKQAFNAAIRGAGEGWLEPSVYGLFEASNALMGLYEKTAMGADPQLPWQRAMASFTSVCSRMFEAKEMPAGDAKAAAMGVVARQAAPDCLRHLKPLLDQVQMAPDDRRREQLPKMSQVARVYQVEALCHLREWNEAEAAIQEASSQKSTASPKLFESLSNIVWTNDDCPPEITLSVCENLLVNGLVLDLLPVEKFSRWLRTVVTLLFQRGGRANIDNALSYCAQAADLIKSREGYPEDEVRWILATSWNRGNEDFRISTSNFARAKSWVEIAQSLLPYTNSSTADQGQRLRARYTELLGKVGGTPAITR